MSVRSDILSFLREPGKFSGTANDSALWLKALENVVLPEIAQRGGYALRQAQLDAWRGLAGERVGLILGPPGTGKTFLLSKLVNGYSRARHAEQLAARTFVTAFTRNAIGNLLAAIAKDQEHLSGPEKARVIFLGNAPEDLDGVDILDADTDGIAEVLEALGQGLVIVGATTWSLNKLVKAASGGNEPAAPLFDLICIDEASQMVVSHGLMSLSGVSAAGRVLVAGDDQQLPPVRMVRDTSLDGRQLGGSLYQFLKSAGIREFALDETFRLNVPLTRFPEAAFYPGRFVSRVGPENDRLRLKADWRTGLSPLSVAALNPDLPVVIAIHDSGGASTSNPFEARLASQIASELSDRLEDTGSEFWVDKVAVVSPHRAQNALIKRSLPQHLRDGAFVETVDRIQGKERDVVVLSYCVSDPEFAVAEGEFIFSKERLNVAITRARFKLIVLVSKQLLDALPTEQEVVDKVELLREFVFGASKHHGEISINGPNGRAVSVELLSRGFSDENVDVDLTPQIDAPVAPELTPRLADTLRAIEETTKGQFPVAKMWVLKQKLKRDAFLDCVRLHHLGLISLEHKEASDPNQAWQARPLGVPRKMVAVGPTPLQPAILSAIKRATNSFYTEIRSGFCWMNDAGQDVLWPHIVAARNEGVIEIKGEREQRRVELASTSDDTPQLYQPDPTLSLEDFNVLNTLEDIEAARINFGVTEAWTSATEVSRRSALDVRAVTTSIGRLEAAGHVMTADEGRLRSRMAEMAREVRLVKQRFRYNDADRRPYLVRNIKVELSDRNKPRRDQPMKQAVDELGREVPADYARALNDVAAAFRDLWNEADPSLAAFQVRSLRAGLKAWVGQGPDTLAIAANTGSGKTEAALLPLIVGALTDVRQGKMGVKAVLAYPRVRLASNQAQRLVHYLAACGRATGSPALTAGLQTAQVPTTLASKSAAEENESWIPQSPGVFSFPFFDCPQRNCGKPLVMTLGGGDAGADRLDCSACKWTYGGWIGTKSRLAASPPDFFLPTSDSLHQWQHNPAYGALWGDDGVFVPPRALVADEIHLYTHIHGAQVGMAFQRLLGRCAANEANGRRPVAIGMSATISEPARTWEKLVGRTDAQLIQSTSDEVDRNPRGREYFYFVQPEIESRNRDIAGASTTIQSLMCLSHGMRRRTDQDGGYRTLAFFDSIDKMRRLHSAFQDAERNQKLARYRITVFDDDPDGTPRPECCRNPTGCDRFDDGECWWFAANDKRQWSAAGNRDPGESLAVADRPVFSGTTGKAEDLIKRSDIIFTTSSLEVGYDDPDITLVYQHYSPMNLASFVQRKGRGGRGSDDRPITAVTLSMYSPRDRWWFRNPRRMIAPSGFETPLNLDNFFVLRGQALTALLDGLARHVFQSKLAVNTFNPGDQALAAAGQFVEQVFGSDIWSRLALSGPKAFWDLARSSLRGAEANLPALRAALDWCPDFLHDTINLPSVTVVGDQLKSIAKQDISLILPTVAPGNATRRFDGQYVHWRAPVHGRAPWFSAEDYEVASFDSLGATSGEDLLDRLPLEARTLLSGLHPKVVRPTQVTMQSIGRMNGSSWTGHIACDPGPPPQLRTATSDGETVSHDSRGELRGALIVSAEAAKARPLSISSPLLAKADLYAGIGVVGGDAGLRAARVYWGADAELRFHSLNKPPDPVSLAQVFVHPKDSRPLLHGYSLQTEGVRFHIDKGALDRCVAASMTHVSDDGAKKKWLSGQFLRYALESGARGMGINAYHARQGADLLVSANADGDLRKELRGLLTFWDENRLATLFENVRTRLLSSHPMYTKARVERTAKGLGDQSVQKLLAATIARLNDQSTLGEFVRSTILHGLALRLKQGVALVGQGDDSRLLAHVRLPIQHPKEGDDVITICEAGQNGDGTIRTVATKWSDVLSLWSDGSLAACPNADEDALLAKFWSSELSQHHAQWRNQDRTDTRVLKRILREISPSYTAEEMPSRLQRILFDFEEFAGQQFAVYDLARESEAVRARLAGSLGRAPLEWELVSAAVSEATASAGTAHHKLLKAYMSVQVDEDEADAATRLSDQIYRLSAPLCFDGCRACVHQSSDMMSDSLVESTTSRSLLQQFMTQSA